MAPRILLDVPITFDVVGDQTTHAPMVHATIHAAATRHERVLLTRHGKPVAAIISAEDLALFEALEDRDDVEAARAALADPDNQEEIPWEQVKADLGL